MEDAPEVTQVELRTMGIGPKKRLGVLVKLKGESASRLLFTEPALGLDAGEIGHCALVSGIRNAPWDPLEGATMVDLGTRKLPDGSSFPMSTGLTMLGDCSTPKK